MDNLQNSIGTFPLTHHKWNWITGIPLGTSPPLSCASEERRRAPHALVYHGYPRIVGVLIGLVYHTLHLTPTRVERGSTSIPAFSPSPRRQSKHREK